MFKQGIIGFNIVLLPAFYFDRHPATLSLVRTLWYPVFYLEKKKKKKTCRCRLILQNKAMISVRDLLNEKIPWMSPKYIH